MLGLFSPNKATQDYDSGCFLVTEGDRYSASYLVPKNSLLLSVFLASGAVP